MRFNPTLSQPPATAPVLSHAKNDRTAGRMPIWKDAQSGQEKIAAHLSSPYEAGFQASLKQSYRANVPSYSTKDERFGFGDLVDMVNPLHHIPLVNIAYRKITGDTIKPIGNVIGGAVFGGPLGAAGGLVNIIVAKETGGGIEDHLFTRKKQSSPSYNKGDLSASLLAFSSDSIHEQDIIQPRYNA